MPATLKVTHDTLTVRASFPDKAKLTLVWTRRGQRVRGSGPVFETECKAALALMVLCPGQTIGKRMEELQALANGAESVGAFLVLAAGDLERGVIAAEVALLDADRAGAPVEERNTTRAAICKVWGATATAYEAVNLPDAARRCMARRGSAFLAPVNTLSARRAA